MSTKMSFPLGFIFLGLLVFFIMMALFRSRHRDRSGRPSRSLAHGALFGLVIFMLLVWGFFGFTDKSQQVIVQNIRPEYPRQVRENPTYSSGGDTPFWQVTVENDFEADLYPSLNSAGRALARKIADRATSLLEGNNVNRRAYIQASNRRESWQRPLEDQALEAVRQELLATVTLAGFGVQVVEQGDRATEPSAASGQPDRPAGPPAGAMVFTLGIPETHSSSAPWSQAQEVQIDGELTISVRFGDEQYRESVKFIEKPWVTDFAAFLSRRPFEDYLIAQSTRVCTQPGDARAGALDNAAEQLTDRILRNVGIYHRRYQLGNQSWSRHDLRSLVRGELERWYGRRPNPNAMVRVSSGGGESVTRVSSNGGTVVEVSRQPGRAHPLICDRFVQCFGRSYGQIWREALLVKADDRNLDELVGMYVATLQHQRRSWIMIALSTAGMLLLVCVLYFFLNAATKGYYSLTLKVLAIVALGLFFLIVHMVIK